MLKTTQPTVLFVSHSIERCGVAQYGRCVYTAIAKSTRFKIVFAPCQGEQDLQEIVLRSKPDIIIYNYHPETLHWLNADITRSLPQSIHVALMHECNENNAHTYTQQTFDYYIFQDPTMPLDTSYHFKTGRLIPEYSNTIPEPEIFTVGTIGFGFACKGVEVLVATVQHQCERARIHLHLPFNEHTDPDGSMTSLVLAERCRKIIQKPGIELHINHNFLSTTELLDAMARCSINAFLYSTLRKGGISSVIDLALAVKRPIAISRCEMFRHIYNATPSILAEEHSLAHITAHGIEPLKPFYEQWNEANFIACYDKILSQIMQQHFLQKNRQSGTHFIPCVSGTDEKKRSTPADKLDLTLFINACVLSSQRHKQGRILYQKLSQSPLQQFQYHECQTADQLLTLVQSFRTLHSIIPRNIIYHYDHETMNWLNADLTQLLSRQKHTLLRYDDQNIASPLTQESADAHIMIHDDSTVYPLNLNTIIKSIEIAIEEPPPFRFSDIFSGATQNIGVSGVTCLNRILNDSARTLYAPIIEVMLSKIPEEMKRKIPRANVQQAFVVDTVAKIASTIHHPKILCVGSYEDTAASTLHALQYPLDAIDPIHNYDLNTFCNLPTTTHASYDIVFSTSVIEHVEDDETFMSDIRNLLKPGGYGIITCDYDDHWRQGQSLPECDWRLYTQRDLADRFMKLLADCVLVGPPAWECSHPDFTLGSYTYTFATMVFQRSIYAKIPSSLGHMAKPDTDSEPGVTNWEKEYAKESANY